LVVADGSREETQRPLEGGADKTARGIRGNGGKVRGPAPAQPSSGRWGRAVNTAAARAAQKEGNEQAPERGKGAFRSSGLSRRLAKA